VEQKGIDVAVEFQRPGQEGQGQVDSPNGREGPEIVFLLAQQAGGHRWEVTSTEPATVAGHYEIRVEELRVASADDRALFKAWKLFLRGEGKRRAYNYPEALELYGQAQQQFHQLGLAVGRRKSSIVLQVTAEDGPISGGPCGLPGCLPWFRQHGPRWEGEILN
jgi:hypothetical protein